MTLGTHSQEQFERALRTFVRPSTPIQSFEYLIDRSPQLNQIEEAIVSPGRHVFIYGDRGAGKTSLAQTVAYLHQSSFASPVFCACGRQTGFASIVTDVVEQLLRRSKSTAFEMTRDVGVVGGIFAAKVSMKEAPRVLSGPVDLNLAATMLKEAAERREGRSIVVVDEFENLASIDDRQLFSELIKQLSDRGAPLAFIFCGVGQSINELLEGHSSSHRYLEGVRLPTPPLSFEGRDALVRMAADGFGVEVDDDVLLRISRVSDGFPHYIHLLCQKMFWAAHRAEEAVEVIDLRFYRQAVTEAIESVEAHLRLSYDNAVKKDRDEYREILWSIADHFDLQRNVRRIYDESYVRIMESRGRIPLDLAQFQIRLTSLRSARHGSILCSERRYWIGFREAMMRGFVRLMAEADGVAIAL